MKAKKAENNKKIYHLLFSDRRGFFISLGAGVLILAIGLSVLLSMHNLNLQAINNKQFFKNTTDVLNNNSNDLTSLIENNHKVNATMTKDLAMVYSGNALLNLETLTPQEQCNIFQHAISRMEQGVWLFIADETGDVISSLNIEDFGMNLFESGIFDRELTMQLFSGQIPYMEIPNPFDEGEDDEVGHSLYVYASQVPGASKNTTKRYAMVAFDTYIIEQATSQVYNIKDWVSSSSIGNGGIAVLIDKDTNQIIYGSMDDTDYIGLDASKMGIPSTLSAQNPVAFSKMGHKLYYISSIPYSSAIYGENMLICSAVPLSRLFKGNFSVVIWSICLFLIVVLLNVSYALYIRYNKKAKHGKQIPLTIFKKKTTYVYNRFIAKRLIPLAIISVLLTYGASFYLQALLSLTDAFETSIALTELIDSRMEDNRTTESRFINYYQGQDASKAELLSFLISMHGNTYLNYDYNNEFVRTNTYSSINNAGQRVYEKDYYGNPVFCYPNNQRLIALCDANDLENIFILDESGHTIVTSDNLTTFSLSKNPESQSYEFWDILNRKEDFILQDPMINDIGEFHQYIATSFDYYTYQNDEGDTCYADYSTYLKSISGQIEFPEITTHTGLFEIELRRDDVKEMINNTKLEYVLSNINVTHDGYLMGFDGEDPHVLFYSPNSHEIGKTAEELGVSEAVFVGKYNGFQNINGTIYLQCYREIEDEYIATSIPLSSLYRGSYSIALYTALIVLLFLFVLTPFTLFSSTSNQKHARLEDMDPATIFANTPDWLKRGSPAKNFIYVVNVAVAILIGVMIIAMATGSIQSNGENTLSYILGQEWTRGIHIFSISTCLIEILFVYFCIHALSWFLENITSVFGNRVNSLRQLFMAILKVASVFGLVFHSLYLLGFDATHLFTSAGILSAVIGFGAQSLIGDVLAGIFIVMEGAIHVGDYVSMEDYRGKVIEIGLRVTKIEDESQNIRIYNNSALNSIINLSQKSTYVFANVPIPYTVNLDELIEALHTDLPALPKKHSVFKDIPQYWGVEQFEDSSIQICIRFLCLEEERLSVQRIFNEEFVRILLAHDIAIPFPQLDIHFDEKYK